MGKNLSQMKRVSKSRKHLLATTEVWGQDNNTEGRVAVLLQMYGHSSTPFHVAQYETAHNFYMGEDPIVKAERRTYVQAEAAVNRWVEDGKTSE